MSMVKDTTFDETHSVEDHTESVDDQTQEAAIIYYNTSDD